MSDCHPSFPSSTPSVAKSKIINGKMVTNPWKKGKTKTRYIIFIMAPLRILWSANAVSNNMLFGSNINSNINNIGSKTYYVFKNLVDFLRKNKIFILRNILTRFD